MLSKPYRRPGFVAFAAALLCVSAMAQNPAPPTPPQNAAPQAATPQADPQQQNRDLTVTKKPTNGAASTTVTIPRSYAVVIGIAAYKNLPATAQLAFPNRDAEDMYAALISPEGGQFPAEN